MKALEWSQYSSDCKSMEIFFRRSGAALQLQVGWGKNLIQAFMGGLNTRKNEEDSTKKW